MPDDRRLDFKTPNYGMTDWADLFTDRQLVALTTFSDLVGEARERIRQDAVAARSAGRRYAAAGSRATGQWGMRRRWGVFVFG